MNTKQLLLNVIIRARVCEHTQIWMSHKYPFVGMKETRYNIYFLVRKWTFFFLCLSSCSFSEKNGKIRYAWLHAVPTSSLQSEYIIFSVVSKRKRVPSHLCVYLYFPPDCVGGSTEVSFVDVCMCVCVWKIYKNFGRRPIWKTQKTVSICSRMNAKAENFTKIIKFSVFSTNDSMSVYGTWEIYRNNKTISSVVLWRELNIFKLETNEKEKNNLILRLKCVLKVFVFAKVLFFILINAF